MNAKKIILLIFLLAILGSIIYPQIGQATSISIPGGTEQEVKICGQILYSTSEDEIYTYLTDPSANVRMTACMRLAEIGTHNSLMILEGLARNDAEYGVREEAAFAYWMIRYKETPALDRENLLIPIVQAKAQGDDSDATKTPRVIGWVIQELGDMGSQVSRQYLEAIFNDTAPNPSLGYFKEASREGILKIGFINSHTPEEAVELGLSNEELCIRIWALDALVQKNPSDLKDRLNALRQQAISNNDSRFLDYIERAIEEIRKKEAEPQQPVIEIEYPEDAAHVQNEYTRVFGYASGKPFSETVHLNYGQNTYTKTVEGASKTITIYMDNTPPVLAPIGNKAVTAGQTLRITLSATDNGSDIMYFVFDEPQGATLDENTRTFTWTPTNTDAGNHAVRFMASDPWGLTDDEVVNITVTADSNQPSYPSYPTYPGYYPPATPPAGSTTPPTTPPTTQPSSGSYSGYYSPNASY